MAYFNGNKILTQVLTLGDSGGTSDTLTITLNISEQEHDEAIGNYLFQNYNVTDLKGKVIICLLYDDSTPYYYLAYLLDDDACELAITNYMEFYKGIYNTAWSRQQYIYLPNLESKETIGALTDLETTDKTSIVNAINELKNSSGGSSGGGDTQHLYEHFIEITATNSYKYAFTLITDDADAYISTTLTLTVAPKYDKRMILGAYYNKSTVFPAIFKFVDDVTDPTLNYREIWSTSYGNIFGKVGACNSFSDTVTQIL